MSASGILWPWVPLGTHAGTLSGVRTHLDGQTAHLGGWHPRRQREKESLRDPRQPSRGGDWLLGWVQRANWTLSEEDAQSRPGSRNPMWKAQRHEGPARWTMNSVLWPECAVCTEEYPKSRLEWRLEESRAQALGSVGQAWAWTPAAPPLGDATWCLWTSLFSF